MFCPKCGTAYEAGLSQCKACDVAPIDMGERAGDSDEELVDLLRTPNTALLAVVKSLLDSSEILYAVQGEEGLRTFPLGVAAGFFNPAAFAAVIRVRRRDLQDARQLLEENAGLPEDGDR